MGHDEQRHPGPPPAGEESSQGAASDPIELGSEHLADPQGPEKAALLEQIANKDKEIAELKDKYLRALADTENVRKRLRQQNEDAVRLQREGLLRRWHVCPTIGPELRDCFVYAKVR